MQYHDYEGPARGLIQKKLKEIEDREKVRILLAVESGSRAWGIASPDSDYDVRFVYVRPEEYYLRLEEKKDFIDWALDETLDINGWDLSKVLRHFHKSNATLYEWFNSPVVYQVSPLWQEIGDTAAHYFSCKSAIYHYYGTAWKNYLQYLTDDMVSYKKYFYVLRPLLACRWIEERKSPPPVAFRELANAMLEEEMKEPVAWLLEQKTRMKEKEKGRRVEAVNRYIEEKAQYYKKLPESMADDRNPDWEPLNRLFIHTVKG